MKSPDNPAMVLQVADIFPTAAVIQIQDHKCLISVGKLSKRVLVNLGAAIEAKEKADFLPAS